MRWLIYAAIAAGLVWLVLPTPGGTGTRVLRVVDGDTIVVSSVGTVRIIGVDTPETYGGVECFGPEAKHFAQKRLKPGTKVSITKGVEGHDVYGRTLAWVDTAEGSYEDAVLERGLARALSIAPNDGMALHYEGIETRARDSYRGLWGSCDHAAHIHPYSRR